MTNIIKNWFSVLESIASKSEICAKRKANRFDTTIWQLPSSKYIAMKPGEVVPLGSKRIAYRFDSASPWKAEPPEVDHDSHQ